MFIDRISLNNFRVYKGQNTIDLSIIRNRNVSIISGNNGFGKTSLLTSLVWCLYGKLMGEVDERYRKEVYESGGYKSYCRKIFNRIAYDQIDISKQAYYNAGLKEKEILEKIADLSTFSVSVRFKQIFIPVIPCNSLEIVRSYNIETETETLVILIDGQINELTKKVGSEIFINDFILRKEIAKFFFFDAEKIVELAEISSIDDKRNLSRAYGEVLGIKKYLDLKNNLENLRLRLKKNNSTAAEQERLEKLNKQFEQNVSMLDNLSIVSDEKEEELGLKRLTSDRFQEQLIREGSSITLEEMKEFREIKEHLQEENLRLKNRMKDMMEMAPLAIAGIKLEQVRNQIESEQTQKDKKNNDELLKRKSKALKKAITSGIQLNELKREQLFTLIENTLLPTGSQNHKILFDFSAEQENNFYAVYDNLQNSFSKNFKILSTDLKKLQTSLSIINRKLSDAESKERDPVIQTIRNNKTRIDGEIKDLEKDWVDTKAQVVSIQKEQNNLALQISELQKKINAENIDKAKDEVAQKLIKNLEMFIYKLKIRKKESLEQNILKELNVLMHKQNFIDKVNVVIQGDLIDIDLYDIHQRLIDKNSLSKGEQQLYATALLKALVEESHIRFPVFIDSPLQKFDKEHARNIISDFYPTVSEQVILFPLLEKELNKDEFTLLYPKIADCYLIQHNSNYQSEFKKIDAKNLFETFDQKSIDVYSN